MSSFEAWPFIKVGNYRIIRAIVIDFACTFVIALASFEVIAGAGAAWPLVRTQMVISFDPGLEIGLMVEALKMHFQRDHQHHLNP